jgi:hypothetical protein
MQSKWNFQYFVAVGKKIFRNECIILRPSPRGIASIDWIVFQLS